MWSIGISCRCCIPKQLARDSKRFSYAVVEKGSGARKYGGSLQWLCDAGIVNFCYCLERPELPLEGNADNRKFKVYMRDTGLLVAMLEDGSQKSILDGDLGIYKGAIYENIVGDMFAKNGRRLYYFEKDSKLEMSQARNKTVAGQCGKSGRTGGRAAVVHGHVPVTRHGPGNYCRRGCGDLACSGQNPHHARAISVSLSAIAWVVAIIPATRRTSAACCWCATRRDCGRWSGRWPI